MTSLSPFSLHQLDMAHLIGFIAMVDDYHAHDLATYRRWYDREWNAGEFRRYVAECEDARAEWRPKANRVSETRYVLTETASGRIVGNGVMRFPLTADVELSGGNLTFDVPPSLRGQGFGALTLNRLLFEAVRAGLARALVTCEPENTAARRAIEKNRGELEREDANGARYWIRFR